MEVRSVTVDAQILGEAICAVLAQGGGFVLTVTGSSMRPTLVPGRDQVCLVAADALKPGDIVFFRRGSGEYVLHRVLRCQGEWLTVNGDSQAWTEQVRRDRVIGRVLRICRKGKWHNADDFPAKLYGRLWPVTRKLRPALIRIKSHLKNRR